MFVWAVVKWFDTKSDFGFVTVEDKAGDILLHGNELRAFGVPSVAEGARILVRVEPNARGGQVAEVRDIRPLATEEPSAGGGPLVPARVKWFDRKLGYGFVNVYGRREDVFLHAATLHKYGFGAVAEGHAIVVRVTAGQRGPTVCEVRDWDYPNRLRGRRRASHRPHAANRSGRASPDGLDLRAAAAIREILRAGVHDTPPGPRAGTALPDLELAALFTLGYYARPGTSFPWGYRPGWPGVLAYD